MLDKVVGKASDAGRALRQTGGRLLFGRERWSAAQVKFVEEARLAVRRALYFVLLLEPYDAEDEGGVGLWGHALKEARVQLCSADVPPRDEWCQDAGEAREDLECMFPGAVVAFADLADLWAEDASEGGKGTDLRSRVDSARAGSWDELRELEGALKGFLRGSLPASPPIQLNYQLGPMALTLIRQHLAFLVALGTVALVCLGVTAVRSLVETHQWEALLAAGAVLLPGIVLFAAQWVLRRGKKTPWWDRGGRVSRALRPGVRQPESWVPLYPNGRASGRVFLGLALKIALYAMGWIVMGGLVWAVVAQGLISPVALTLYMIGVLLAGTVLLGALVDLADLHSQAPLRIWLLVGAAIYLALLLSDFSLGWIWVVLLGLAGFLFWWTWKVRQAHVFYVLVPVLAVALITDLLTQARREATTWTPQPRESVEDYLGSDEWPFPSASSELQAPLVVMASSGGGSRAAIYTARTLERLERDFPALARNLQAISSVSGGSLANAAYVMERLRGSGLGPEFSEPCANTLAETVAGDYLRPTLLGLVRGGRGRAIEEAWNDCPGLEGVSLNTLKRVWRERIHFSPEAGAPFPVPLFNSVMLHRHAVVLTPLSRSLYATPALYRHAREENRYDADLEATDRPTWVLYRSGIYGLEDLLPHDPPLASVVRASANFPFGFPLVRLRTSRGLPYSPVWGERWGSNNIVRLTDGGALSNSGMWSLFSLLMEQRDRLRGRPVLLIVVEASRMPPVKSRHRVLGLVGTLLDVHPKGESLHRRMLEELSLALAPCFHSVQVDLPHREALNVYTTWALDGHSLEILDEAFDAKWEEVGPRLEDEWPRVVERCRGESPPPSAAFAALPNPVRVPVH